MTGAVFFPVTLVKWDKPKGLNYTTAYQLAPSLVNEAGKVTDFAFDGYGCQIQQDGKFVKGPPLQDLQGDSNWKNFEVILITDDKGSKLLFKEEGFEDREMSLGGKYTPYQRSVINAKTVIVLAGLVTLAAGLYFGLRSPQQTPTVR